MAQPTRILFVIGSLGGGGSERQLIALLQSIDRDRFQPLLFVPHGTGELLPEVPSDIAVHSFWDRYHMPTIRVPGQVSRAQSRVLAGLLEKERVDVVCDRNWEMTLLAWQACRFRPTPRVSVIGSHPARDLQLRGGRWRWLKSRLLKRAYRAADRVVAVSEGVRTNAVDYYGLNATVVQTIHSFVDPERVEGLASAADPQFDADRFHLVCVGRLTPEKGYATLLEAADILVNDRRLRRLSVLILGQGPLQETLQKDLELRGLRDHVRLLGFHENPYPFLKLCDAYCLPSLFEGMPNALLEAVVCGAPAIASDCPSGPGEILREGELGTLVPPGDAAALADAIERVADDPTPFRKLAAEARLHVVQNFSLSASVPKFEALFRGLVSEPLR